MTLARDALGRHILRWFVTYSIFSPYIGASHHTRARQNTTTHWRHYTTPPGQNLRWPFNNARTFPCRFTGGFYSRTPTSLLLPTQLHHTNRCGGAHNVTLPRRHHAIRSHLPASLCPAATAACCRMPATHSARYRALAFSAHDRTRRTGIYLCRIDCSSTPTSTTALPAHFYLRYSSISRHR